MQQRKTFMVAARNAVQGMRVHQWLKNILIFVPAAAAHNIADAHVFARVFLAFFSFSVCASSGYLVNDLLDLKADRQHPRKSLRPFASGALSRGFAIILAFLLFLTAVGFGLLVSRRYVLFLCGYLVLTVAYSLVLKTMMPVDIFLLAFFYTFRIMLGGEAASVLVSFWLAAFSVFFFFSLAVAKRFVEVRLLMDGSKYQTARRDYRPDDLSMLGMWGAASGCASVVVLALYINSQDVTRLYRHPVFLWPVCLAVLFWLTRVWMLANRNELPYDPVEFAVRDWRTYVIAVFVLLSIAFAI